MDFVGTVHIKRFDSFGSGERFDDDFVFIIKIIVISIIIRSKDGTGYCITIDIL